MFLARAPPKQNEAESETKVACQLCMCKCDPIERGSSPGRVSQGMRESPYKAASSRWPTAATDRAQTNKTTRESNEMHLKTRRKH